MPMPIDVVVRLQSGEEQVYHIPLRIMRGEKGKDIYNGLRETLKDWPWTYPYYELSIDENFNQIESIEIDPSKRMADVNLKNNVFPSFNHIKFVDQ